MSDAWASGEPSPPLVQLPIPVASMVAGLVDRSNLRGQESPHRLYRHLFIGMDGNNDPKPSGSGQAMLHDDYYVSDQDVISDTDFVSEEWTNVTSRKILNKRKSTISPNMGNSSFPNKKRNIGGYPIFKGNLNLKCQQPGDTLLGTMGTQNREPRIKNPAPNCPTEKGSR